MVFINWTEEENVNIKIVDDQHRTIVAIVNDLYTTLGTDHNFYAMERTEKLLTDLRIHFDTEEKLMQDSKCPFYISHKMEHDRFLTKIENFRNDLEQGRIRVNLELLNSTKKWLFNHIELNDRKFANYLIEQAQS